MGLERRPHRCKARRLHSNDANCRIVGLHRDGDAAHQPAAAHRNHHGFHIRQLLNQFQANGALPRDDGVVVEGMDIGEPLRFAEAQRFLVGLIVIGPVKVDFGAILAGGGHLGEWRGERHDDGGANPQPRGMVGHTLGMIAGGRADDAVPTLIVRQLQQLVQGPALFEGAGHL